MPSLDTTPNLCVDEVLAFDDAELVDYMKQNLRPDGGFDLEFDGWEKLPKDQRDRLAERLRTGADKVNDAVQSRPVDADQLTARLLGIADTENVGPEEPAIRARHDRTPTEPCDLDAEAKREETLSYNKLVNDGGRPVYPINNLEEIFPGAEDEMLRPWQEFPGNCHSVFTKQLYRWEMFRRWQHHNREPDEEEDFAAFVEEKKRVDREGTEFEPTASQYLEILRKSYQRKQLYNRRDDGEAGFAIYIEEKKRRNIQFACTWPGMTEDEYMQMLRVEFKKKQAKEGTKHGDEDEGFTAFVEDTKRWKMKSGRRWPGMTEDELLYCLRKKFKELQNTRSWMELDGLGESDDGGGFPEYVAEAKRRLTRYGFTKAFELDKDPARQDKWTTWVEYLNYEYAWFEKHTRLLARLRPKYDAGWQKLVDSGVLRRGETAAGFFSMAAAIQSQSAIDAAAKAVERARTAAKDVLHKAMMDPESKSKIPKRVRVRMMQDALHKLEAAQASSREVNKREGLITEFVQGASKYEHTERDLALQNIRLQWVKGQVPLVEAEVREVKSGENSLNTRRKSSRMLEDGQEDEGATARSRKRKKPTHQGSSPSDDLGPSTRARAAKRSRPEQHHKESRGYRRSSGLQQVTNGVNTTTTNSQPTVGPVIRERAGVVEKGSKIGGDPRHGQSRSTTVQSQTPTQEPRRSPRFAATQGTHSEVAVPPSSATRAGLRPRRKGT